MNNREGTGFDSILNGNVAHAYIIEGPAGEERTTFVRNIVKSLLCEERDPVTGHACGMCPSCRKIDRGTHEDVFAMERSGKSSYLVKDAAGMLERLAMRPYGDRNIGIVDNADLLGEIVQNKLLKTLEEPYPGTVIFLETSNRAGLLPTVRSRCVLIRMEDVGTSDADDDMENAVRGLCDMYGQGCFFHEYREYIDKNFKAREYAMAFLDMMEEDAGGVMVSDRKLSEQSDRCVFEIRSLERTRMDIARGMGYKQALKRLFLELR